MKTSLHDGNAQLLWRIVKPSPANPQEDSLFTLRMLPVPLSVPFLLHRRKNLLQLILQTFFSIFSLGICAFLFYMQHDILVLIDVYFQAICRCQFLIIFYVSVLIFLRWK